MDSGILSFYFSYDVSLFPKETDFDVNLYLYYSPLILMEELISFCICQQQEIEKLIELLMLKNRGE